ncbi:MAG: 4-hydroxy-tetrahydrodipicolinate reductase [Spirochaetaceae bacterium]|jgi:4-hydroxy-tetrahydrodipicolinate reductase|nr:4-hydroxy-tetrahydrodipicolinate reductase [Spirochaetaceae bacterium]
MNIAIIGFGKMGKTLEKFALEKGHHIAAIVDPFIGPDVSGAKASLSGAPLAQDIAGAAALDKADVALEFTRPDTALANIKALAKRKIPVVTGTTGWLDKLDEAQAAVHQAGSSLVWASNYSLGVKLLSLIASYAAELFNKFPEYDLGGYEIHHNQKADSPSGTAKTLAALLLEKFTRKKSVVWDTLNRKALPTELHFPSLRIGSVPGTHGVIFDSEDDSVEILHKARNRDSLARGALRAAEWLTEKKRKGVFTIEDILSDIIQ